MQESFTGRWGTPDCVYWYQSWVCRCGCWWERYRAYLSAHAADHYKATAGYIWTHSSKCQFDMTDPVLLSTVEIQFDAIPHGFHRKCNAMLNFI